MTIPTQNKKHVEYTREQILHEIEDCLDWYYNKIYDGGNIPSFIRSFGEIFANNQGYWNEWDIHNFVSDYFSQRGNSGK